MSISFIWYQVFWIGALDEAYVTSWKIGLNFNALDLLISVLSNKAVLAFAYEWIKGDKCCYGTLVEYDADDLQIKLSVLRGGSQSLCIFLCFLLPNKNGKWIVDIFEGKCIQTFTFATKVISHLHSLCPTNDKILATWEPYFNGMELHFMLISLIYIIILSITFL